MPAAKQMEVEMKYRLPGFRVGIHYEPETARVNISFFGDFGCRFMHAEEDFFVNRSKFKNRGNVFPGYNQDMDRCFRIQILKSDHKLVLIHNFTGYLLARYFAEDTAYHSPAFSSLGGF